MGRRKINATNKPWLKKTQNIQSENDLIEEYNEHFTRVHQLALAAATEQYSPSLMGMMYGDIIPTAVWKMMFLCDRMATDEERCTCLCLLTDYLSKECCSLGLLDSNTSSGLLGPINNILRTLATMWNNALLNYYTKKGNLYTQLSSNLQSSIKVFTLYGFQEYFTQSLQLIRELDEGSQASVRKTVPPIPNHSRINYSKLCTILDKAYSPRKDPYEDSFFQESHYRNNQFYRHGFGHLNQFYSGSVKNIASADSDPEYIPDDSFTDESLLSFVSSVDDLDDDSNGKEDKENEMIIAKEGKKTMVSTAPFSIISSNTQTSVTDITNLAKEGKKTTVSTVPSAIVSSNTQTSNNDITKLSKGGKKTTVSTVPSTIVSSNTQTSNNDITKLSKGEKKTTVSTVPSTIVSSNTQTGIKNITNLAKGEKKTTVSTVPSTIVSSNTQTSTKNITNLAKGEKKTTVSTVPSTIVLSNTQTSTKNITNLSKGGKKTTVSIVPSTIVSSNTQTSNNDITKLSKGEKKTTVSTVASTIMSSNTQTGTKNITKQAKGGKKTTVSTVPSTIVSSNTQTSTRDITKQVLTDVPKKYVVSERKVSSISAMDSKTGQKKDVLSLDRYDEKNARGIGKQDKTTSYMSKVWSMSKAKEGSTNKSVNDKVKITATSQSSTVDETRRTSKDNIVFHSGWISHNDSDRSVNCKGLSPVFTLRAPNTGTPAITISSTTLSEHSVDSEWSLSSFDSRSRHSSGTSSLGVMSLSSDTTFMSENSREAIIVQERAPREIQEDFLASPVKAPHKLNFKKRISDIKVKESLQKREQNIKELQNMIKPSESIKPEKNFWKRFEGDLKAENNVADSNKLGSKEKTLTPCQPLVEREMNKIMKKTVSEKRKRKVNVDEVENKPKRSRRTKGTKKPKCFCCKSPEYNQYIKPQSQDHEDTKTPIVSTANSEICGGTARQIFPLSPVVPSVSPRVLLTTTPSKKVQGKHDNKNEAFARNTQDIRCFFASSPQTK